MNWDVILQSLLAILATLGGAGVVLVALLVWLGKIWENLLSTRLTARQNKELEDLKNEYAKDLERLRAEITERQELFSNTSNALSSGYMASHPHIVDAIYHLWSVILDIDNLTSSFFFPYSVLLPHEIESHKPEYIYRNIPLMAKDEFLRRVTEINDKPEVKRPFIGENLWLLFSVYRTFALRLCWKIREGHEKGQVYSWDKDMQGRPDQALMNTIRTILSDDEIQVLISTEISVPQRILNSIKSKILSEMNELVFGKRLINMSFEEQQRVNSLLSGLQSGVNKAQVERSDGKI